MCSAGSFQMTGWNGYYLLCNCDLQTWIVLPLGCQLSFLFFSIVLLYLETSESFARFAWQGPFVVNSGKCNSMYMLKRNEAIPSYPFLPPSHSWSFWVHVRIKRCLSRKETWSHLCFLDAWERINPETSQLLQDIQTQLQGKKTTHLISSTFCLMCSWASTDNINQISRMFSVRH